MDEIRDQHLNSMTCRLEEQFEHIRGLISPGYRYNSTPAHRKAFEKAAEFCIREGLTPEEYAYGVYQSVYGHPEHFYPSNFGAATANRAALEYKANSAVPLRDLLDYQKEMLYNHVKNLEEDPIDVLMNPRLKFNAWFRITATKEPNEEIIKAYRRVAQEEITPEVRQFLLDNNLGLGRII